MTSHQPTSLWRSGLHTLAASVFSVAIGFGTSILIARSLGPANKGSYDLMMASGSLASLVLGLSLPIGATYAIARGLAAPGALIRRLLAWGLVQGVIVVVLVVTTVGNPIHDALLPSTLGAMVAIPLATLVAATSVTAYLRAVLIGQQRIITANTGDLIGRIGAPSVMVAGVGIALLLGTRPNPLLFVWCAISGLGITIAYFCWRLITCLRASQGPSGMRVVLSFSAPSYLANVVQFLNYRLDLFLVNVLVGLAAVGIYNLAVSVAQLLWLLAQAAASVLLPRVANEIENSTANAVRSAQVARLVFIATALAAIVLALFGRLFIPVVYGEAFRSALEPFLLLLPGVVGFSVVTVITSYFAGIGRPALNLAVATAGLAVTLALDLTLIPWIGIRGAAIASTASYLTSMAMTAAIFSRMTGVSPVRLVVPTRGDLALVHRLASTAVHRPRVRDRG